MNRRLFVSQLAMGVAGCSVPGLLAAQPSDGQSRVALFERVTRLLATGVLGPVRQLTLIQVYNSKYTTEQDLLAIVRQDIHLTERLTGLSLPVNANGLLTRATSTDFGSYSAQFEHEGMLVTWQALNRVNSSVSETTRTLRLLGSDCFLRLNLHNATHQLVNFTAPRLQPTERADQLAGISGVQNATGSGLSGRS